MNTESLGFSEWLIEKAGNIPPVVFVLIVFIIIASLIVLAIAVSIVAFDKVRWIYDLEVRLSKEPLLLYSLAGEQLVAELVFLTFGESLEVTNIKSKLVKDGIDAFGEVAHLEITKVQKLNQNLKSEKIERFEYTSAIDLMPAFSTSRQNIFFSIQNGENKVKSQFEDFKIAVFNFVKEAESYKVQNGVVNTNYVKKNLLDLKNTYTNNIINSAKIIDGDYKLSIEVQYRILDGLGRKSKEEFHSTHEIGFRVQKAIDLMRVELDDILGKMITNILNAPATASKIRPIRIHTNKLSEIINVD